MSLIEGIGDEVTNFLIIVISTVILYLAWRSTNVRDERIPRTAVLILESNRRRLLDRVAQHPVTISILRNASSHSNGLTTDTEELDIDDQLTAAATTTSSSTTTIEQITEAPSLQLVLDEVSELTSGTTYPSSVNHILLAEEYIDDIGPQEIIRDMDSDNNSSASVPDGVRRRHIQHHDHINLNNPSTSQIIDNNNSTASTSSTNAQDNPDKSDNTDNCTNENSENGNVIENMHRFMSAQICTNQTPNINSNTVITATISNATNEIDSEFRIKLKYLNDDLKLVKGTPNEAIGDFKKRNFSAEISNQKVVRLVFNGHVLQPDSKTLQACGLFDNCVVHCLVHNQRPTIHSSTTTRIDNTSSNSSTDDPSGGIDFNTNPNETNEVIFNNGQLLVYFGLILLCLVLVILWYFRIQYFQLFNWYSTIGLFLLTALFLVIFPLVYLIERDANI